jgi:YopX protein.
MIWKTIESEYYGNDGGFDLDWTVEQDGTFEVTGNIYENKELLERGEV